MCFRGRHSRIKFLRIAQNLSMAKRRTDNIIDDLFEQCVSANECTGLYQKVSLDTKEIAKFHKQYNEEEKEGN